MFLTSLIELFLQALHCLFAICKWFLETAIKVKWWSHIQIQPSEYYNTNAEYDYSEIGVPYPSGKCSLGTEVGWVLKEEHI